MSAVKPSRSFSCCILVTAAALAVASCSNTSLSRFAPPGIVKYEDIASEKPQNPEVAARIAERRAEKGAGKFPRLSATPGKEDRPEPLPAEEVDAELDMLSEKADRLAAAVADDRAAAEAEMAEDLQAKREDLTKKAEEDSLEAARDRRSRPANPDPQ